MTMGWWKWSRRLAWAAFGAAWFVWLGYEDQGTRAVLLLALLLALALYLEGWFRWGRGPSGARPELKAAALGLCLGAAVPLLGALFMLMKVSLHTHVEPDFTVRQVLATLARTPAWGLAGLLAGVAAGLLLGQKGDGKSAHVAEPDGVEYNNRAGNGRSQTGKG